MAESMLLMWAALALYAVAAARAWHRPGQGLPALWTALLLHTGSLALRWQAVGHGPFTTLHEILSSNLWSLALVFAVAATAVRDLRHALLPDASVWAVLGAWLAVSDPSPGHLPATYDTPLLYLHTVVGKLFLGLLLVALAAGAVPWWRRTQRGRRLLAGAADDARQDGLCYRFAALALVFDSLMLIVGAVWAQDAWGRYWAWDPLESWAFATWVALVMALHARHTLRPAPTVHAAWISVVFVIAFLTFFGVPFLSMAPHKGAV